MKVSLNLMRQYSDGVQWELPLPELVTKIGAQLGAVEETINLAGKYTDVYVADIIEAKDHPTADKLGIYKIDTGGGHVQVLAGDKTLNVGDKVAWIKPGATVPVSWGTAEPFIIGEREMRGEVSCGMLGSGKELDINDDHSHVQVLDTDVPAGTPFADAYDLSGDAIIDIENKMFTHRPDGFGNLGVAREIAGIQNLPFQSPGWYALDAPFPQANGERLKLQVVNEIPDLVPRYMAVVMDNIAVKPSPLQLQSYLRRLGIRPINNVVDITNYIMVVTGQPLHAFDYDKVAGQKIVIRKPKKGEKLPLLDGKIIEPHKDAILICDEQKPIGLGGMMGGANSAIDAQTTRVVLECATFDMYTIRRTSMQHGIFTDAVTRYSKGQSPLQCAPVLAKTVVDLLQATSGRLASEVIDKQAKIAPLSPVATSATFINNRLGGHLEPHHIAVLLNNVEFAVEEHADELIITPPFWRTDIEIPEDIVEEIGRLHGYENLPHSLPTRDTAVTQMPAIDQLKTRIREIMSRAGANELQTYSFVPERLLQQVGQSAAHAFSIRNALSPDLQHYRLSLTPSLLEKVHSNIKAGYTQFGLFELNKIHIKGEQDVDCDGLPREYQTIAFVFAGQKQPGAAYYQAKRYLDYLLNELGVRADFKPADPAPGFEIGRQVFAPFEPKRSAYVYAPEGDFAGFIGEYRAAVVKNLKLPVYSAGFEVDLERLLKHQHHLRYQPLLKFPATDQDVCLKVKQSVAYAELEAVVVSNLQADSRLRVTVTPLDIYQRDDDASHKQITFRIALQHHDRTLTTAEVNDMLDVMVKNVDAQIKVERI